MWSPSIEEKKKENGYFFNIYTKTQDNSYLIKCACLPEMKKDRLYKINVVLDSSGDVTEASYDCAAGVGPHGSCKHISALCYTLEDYSKVKSLQSPVSCTSQLQQWNQPRKRKLEPCNVADISCVKHEHGKQKRPASSMVYDPRPIEMQSTSHTKIASLRQKIIESGEDIGLIHLLPITLPAPSNLDPTLPPPPSLVRELILKELQNKPQSVDCNSISAAGVKFLAAVKYSADVIREIERVTRGQRLQALAGRKAVEADGIQIWFDYLTASKPYCSS